MKAKKRKRTNAEYVLWICFGWAIVSMLFGPTSRIGIGIRLDSAICAAARGANFADSICKHPLAVENSTDTNAHMCFGRYGVFARGSLCGTLGLVPKG